MSAVGCVFIVGAGPGDPGLITVKGLECLRAADVVVHDRLVDKDLLKEAREDARLIDVGKTPHGDGWAQEDINRLLWKEAAEGNLVVRLKNGDPFVFGRGGEEALFLTGKGIPCEVVPGLTSAFAVPALAGIPVTHRGVSRAVTVTTGHFMPGSEPGEIHWERIWAGCDTLVILMGVERLGEIFERLLRAGTPPHTPAAALRHGAPGSRVMVVGDVGDLPHKVRKAGLSPPMVILVGETVRLLGERKEGGRRPMERLSVLVAGPERARRLCTLLECYGAEAMFFQAVTPVLEGKPISREELEALRECTWLIFMSENAVWGLWRNMGRHGVDARFLHGRRVCAIGPATAAALRKIGVRADVMPDEHSSRGIAALFSSDDLERGRTLLVCSRANDRRLLEDLSRMGIDAEVLPVYDLVETSAKDTSLICRLEEGLVDVILFTSPSAVRGFVNAIEGRTELIGDRLAGSIGPATSMEMKRRGIRVSFQARECTYRGTVTALLARLKEKGKENT